MIREIIGALKWRPSAHIEGFNLDEEIAKDAAAPHRNWHEFLIRRTDDEWFTFHRDRNAYVLRPTKGEVEVVDGNFEHCILVDGRMIGFSFEDPGIQVTIDADGITQPEAAEIARQILESIETKAFQRGRIVEL